MKLIDKIGILCIVLLVVSDTCCYLFLPFAQAVFGHYVSGIIILVGFVLSFDKCAKDFHK